VDGNLPRKGVAGSKIPGLGRLFLVDGNSREGGRLDQDSRVSASLSRNGNLPREGLAWKRILGMGRLFLGNDNFPIEGVAWIRIPGMGRSGESSRNFWRRSLRGGALLSSGGALQGDVLLSSGGALSGGTHFSLLVDSGCGATFAASGVGRTDGGRRQGAAGMGQRGGKGNGLGWDDGLVGVAGNEAAGLGCTEAPSRARLQHSSR
jgi:hypothetical protein